GPSARAGGTRASIPRTVNRRQVARAARMAGPSRGRRTGGEGRGGEGRGGGGAPFPFYPRVWGERGGRGGGSGPARRRVGEGGRGGEGGMGAGVHGLPGANPLPPDDLAFAGHADRCALSASPGRKL